MEIETKSASLDTLAVTIQALHVNGKQMTLAVFRQLPIKDTYLDDGSLAPMEYWGLIRYQIKEQGDVWVVCSKDGCLYRCDLRARGNFFLYDAERWVKRSSEAVFQNKKYLDDAIARYKGQDWGAADIDRKRASLEEKEAELADAKAHLDICKRVEQSSQVLEKLPQLFIAV